jgi:prepilin-type N-terminal cleavage/methylation domain-containing protein
MSGARARQGFTLVEAVVVIAILGILATAVGMSLRQSQSRAETRKAAASLAGVLQEARDRAVGSGVPHLVYFQGGGGSCADRTQDPVVLIVEDRDASYSRTTGDAAREFRLQGVPCYVTPYGAGEDTPYEDMPPADTDLSASAALEPGAGLPDVAGSPGGGSSNGGHLGQLKRTIDAVVDLTPTDPEVVSEPPAFEPIEEAEAIAERVTHGATFAIDAQEGVPALAFTPGGVAVSPSAPTTWGSGAGAFYLTDNRTTVYAVTVSPLGQISIELYDPIGGDWN